MANLSTWKGLDDLMNITDTNAFNDVITKTIREKTNKISTNHIELEKKLELVTKVYLNSDSITIHGYDTTLDFLRKFGHLISKLEVSSIYLNKKATETFSTFIND